LNRGKGIRAMAKTSNHKIRPQRGSSRATPKPRRGRGAERVFTEAGVAKGVKRSYEAFLRALPNLLREPRNQRLWAAFHGDDFVAIAPSQRTLTIKCLALGFPSDSFYIGWITPQSATGVEEVDPSLFEVE
jgi:hypothetical protein